MKKVAILTGGESSEREIALQSAETVKEALTSRADVSVFVFPEEMQEFISRRGEFNSCVPVFHGKGGEDGKVQGFLETLGVPFIFSGVAAHAVGMDKALTKELAKINDIPTPEYHIVERGEKHHVGCPVVVKPIDSGSSVGVTIVKEEDQAQKALEDAFADSERVIVEDFIEGDEFTVAIIDDAEGPVALPVILIKSKNEFFDFASKYDPELFEEICPAPIDKDLAERLQDLSVRAHKMIGARHLSRSDFMVDKDGNVWFLEINTIPGLTANSLVPKAIEASGRDFGEVLMGWIEEVSN